MDKIAKQLKDDAARIDVQISDELDRRISASLQGVTPEIPETDKATQRPVTFWWASSLTGVAAALIIVAMINSQSQIETVPALAPEVSPVTVATIPTIDWKAESAMLTRPLQQELEDLQEDLKKAEEKVKREIGL
ncbi:MAG: hypothetical protein GWP67_06145 [Gammaproteobacteria bacterium]|jgi:hypothetical protein|nr:hypothetical protein [Gammaproteobacteria bacterium]